MIKNYVKPFIFNLYKVCNKLADFYFGFETGCQLPDQTTSVQYSTVQYSTVQYTDLMIKHQK